LPDAPLHLLVADPPWPFKDKLPGPKRGAESHYRVLSIADLMRFPLPPIAADAALLLWRVASQQREALDVAAAWGFVVKSEIVWRKLRRCGPCNGRGTTTVRGKFGPPCGACRATGFRDYFGMGRSVRAAHEVCLIATRGRPRRLSASIPSVLSAAIPEDAHGRPIHSAKPDAFYDLAARLYDGPRGELFARRRRDGWWQDGDELPEV
jgi:N6-adenosine-specific RNA methylase IME4